MGNFLRYVRRNAFQFGMLFKALFLVALLWGTYFSSSLFAADSNFAMGKHHSAGELAASVFWQLVLISLLVFIWASLKSISPVIVSLISGVILACCSGEQALLIALAIAGLSALLYLCGYFMFRGRRHVPDISMHIDSDQVSRFS